jgi:hypothetical protein
LASPKQPPAATSTNDDDTLARFRAELAKAEQPHKTRVAAYQRWDDSYNATLTPAETVAADEWRSALHPPYVFQTIQTIKALIVDDKPIATVAPPKGKPEQKDKAQAYENVLNEQRRDDDYDAKLDLFVLQGLVRGVTVAKVGWEYARAMVRQQSLTPVYGSVMPDRSIQEAEQTITNRPTITVCDVKDIMWDRAATSADTITTLFSRTYETKASLQSFEDDGLYRNVDQVTTSGYAPQDRPGARDVKDLVEVIERWQKRADGIWLTTVANRNVVLRDEASPFIHQELPFVFCAPTPALFKVEGKAEPELINDLQTALWQNQNQRKDNVELINNCVVIIQDSEQDPDSWVVKPGGRWFTNHSPSSAVQFMTPNTSILEPSIKEEELMKGDMQDISAASPYVSGADSQGIDNKTATGISLVQNMATKRILQKKQRFADAERMIGRQQLQLNEQLAPDLLPAYSSDGSAMPLRIQDIIGCTYEVEDAAESLNRQERRSEAALMLNTVAALVAVPGVAQMVNWRQLLEDFFESYDADPQQLLVAPQPTMLGGAPPMALPGAPGALASGAPPMGGPPSAMPTTPFNGAGALGSIPGGQAA